MGWALTNIKENKLLFIQNAVIMLLCICTALIESEIANNKQPMAQAGPHLRLLKKQAKMPEDGSKSRLFF